MSLGELEMRMEISPPAVWCYVEREKDTASEDGYWLIEYFLLVYLQEGHRCQTYTVDKPSSETISAINFFSFLSPLIYSATRRLV